MRVAPLVTAFALAVAVSGGAAPVRAVAWDPPAPALPERLLGVTWKDEVGTIARFDPRTLKPLSQTGPRVGIFSGHAFSPNGSQVVLARARDDKAALKTPLVFVDVERMRRLGVVALPRGAYVSHVYWAAADRVLAVYYTPRGMNVAVVDAIARRLVRTQAIEGSIQMIRGAGDRLVALVAPDEGIGPSRLVVLDRHGGVRTAAVGRIWSGSEFPQTSEGGRPAIGRTQRPALAVDVAGGRAVVVSAGRLVADIDLASLSVSYYSLTDSTSVLDRFRSWLLPQAQAKAIDGPMRTATWLGDGRIAVTGTDYRAWLDAAGRERMRYDPAGLAVIDTREWQLQTIDPRTNAVTVAGGGLLATGAVWASSGEEPTGSGVALYGLDGGERFRILDGEPASVIAVVGDRAYVARKDQEIAVVEVTSGRILGSLEGRFPTLLLPSEPSGS